MTFFGIRSFVLLCFFTVGGLLSIVSPTFAGTCTVQCSGAMVTGGGGRASSITHSFEVPRRSQCMGVCPAVCQTPPGSWVGVPRDGSASCVGAPVFSGSEAAPPPPIVDGTCEAVCGNDYMRDTLYLVEPERILSAQDCATRCREACSAAPSPLGDSYACIESSFHAPRDSGTGGRGATKQDCAWWEQEDGVCVPGAGGNSNKTGAAARKTGGSVSASSGNCTFNGVHDPFCGKTIPQIIGNIVRFLLGAAGALFLAMFVYGGAVWLTAGSSDRHEEAQKTLVNAAAGILIVVASYTIVSLLVRFAGGLGVSQSNEAPRLDQEASDETPSTAGSLPTADAAARPGTCNASNFVTACREECRTSVLVGIADRREECNSACAAYGPNICSAVRSPSDCGSGCTTLCASPEVPSIARGFCSSECEDLCAAAFR